MMTSLKTLKTIEKSMSIDLTCFERRAGKTSMINMIQNTSISRRFRMNMSINMILLELICMLRATGIPN